ncbi:hypothetical protein [Streptosporangium vulgare]|uniref:hypothetical protein n=1 Tax=Streptosporangium vulgare TaxID=46190 RepID=UPI0031DAA5D9
MSALDAHKELKRVFNGEDAAVYTLKTFPEGAEIPEPGRDRRRRPDLSVDARSAWARWA